MSPWQLERKSDPRKPNANPDAHTRQELARDELELRNARRNLQDSVRQPIIIDDGE